MGCGSSKTAVEPGSESEKPPLLVRDEDTRRGEHKDETGNFDGDHGDHIDEDGTHGPVQVPPTKVNLIANGEVCVSQSGVPHENGEAGGEMQPSSFDESHAAVKINERGSLPEEPHATEEINEPSEVRRRVLFITTGMPRTEEDGESAPQRLEPGEVTLTNATDRPISTKSKEDNDCDHEDQTSNQTGTRGDNNNEAMVKTVNLAVDHDVDTFKTGTTSRNTMPEPQKSSNTQSKPAAEIEIPENLSKLSQKSDEVVASNHKPHSAKGNAPFPKKSEPRTEEENLGDNLTPMSHDKWPKTEQTLSVEHETVAKETEKVTSEDGAKLPSRGTGTAQESILDRVRREALEMHNIYRARHGVPPLVLNNTLNKYSQKWAEKMASMRKLEHSPQKNRPNYGENIYYSGSTHFNVSDVKGETSISAFYDEIKDYDYDNPGQRKKNGGQIGHFTQVVWKDSKELGVGMATAKKGNMGYVYICCNYSPPGNWVGRYEQHVLPPISDVPETPKFGSEDGSRDAPGETNNRPADGKPTVGESPLPNGKETPLERVRRELLQGHNAIRARHNLPPLTLNGKLAKQAQQWATKMANTKKFEPSPMSKKAGYGENIFTAGSSNFKMSNVKGAEVAAFFCDEIKQDANMGRFANSWNTINTCTTELAWKTSQQLGVGMATTKQGKMEYVYICCDYS
ncbi:uncharacterized protein LOC119724210 [Patiria miniata]|uniref:SCP domain-containing protein n=1 Tax=Patiria miniata TaxID=46514 RepID=A0A913ZJ56_PATMI|nr:uncharacterized protein LOC119724210 [Patiria miniata]